MSRVCPLTGKRPMVGNNVSHANNKTKRRFLPNLQKRRVYDPDSGKFISLRLSARALRWIDKLGLKVALAKIKQQALLDKER